MKSANPSLNPANHAQSQPESPFLAITSFHRIATIVILAIYLIGIGIQELLHPSSIVSLGWVFLALILQFVILLVPIIFYQSSYGWLHPLIFSFLFALLNHLRRTGTYIDGLQWHSALPGWDANALTLLLAFELGLRSMSLVAYYFGFWLCPNLAVPKLSFHQPRHLEFKSLLVVLFSTAIFLVYTQGRGGLINHLLSWGRGRNVELAGEFYWQFLIQFGLTICLLWFALDRKALLKPLFLGCAGISCVATFLTGGSRSSVIYVIVMALMIWLLRERRVDPIKILSIAIIGFLLFGVLGNFRNSTSSGEVDWGILLGGATGETADESALSSGLDEATARGTVVAGVFPILALVPQEVDFLYGSSYLAVLTLPIPKALWAEKPGLIPGLVGQTFYGVDIGMPPGPIGEAYWNFGIPGILIAFFLFGILCKWLATVYCQYATEPVAIALYVMTLFLLSEPTGLSAVLWLTSIVPALLFLFSTGAVRFGQNSQK